CAYNADHMVTGQGPSRTCDQAFNGQPSTCTDFCLPLAPNGCDCFGCCELPAGTNKFVWLGSRGATGTTQCTPAEVDNPEICHPCTPVPGCYNPCDTCEVCIGKPLPPPECFEGEGGGSATSSVTVTTGTGD